MMPPSTADKKRKRGGGATAAAATASSSSSNSIAIKRNEEAQMQMNIPTIANVSPDIVPLLLEAVKKQKKLITLQHKLAKEREYKNTGGAGAGDGCLVTGSDLPDPFQLGGELEDDSMLGRDSGSASSLSASVKDTIFARMDDTRRMHPLLEPLHALLRDVRQHQNTLLDALGRRDSTRDHVSREDEDMDSFEPPTSDALGCLIFLLDIVQDDTSKIILRHAVVCTIRVLVLGRRDCCSIFTKKVKSFVDAVGNASKKIELTNGSSISGSGRRNTSSGASSSALRHQVTMMQREALILLHDLSERYQTSQPTIVIAKRYLEEKKGVSLGLRRGQDQSGQTAMSSHSLAMHGLSNADMIDLRRIRDVALKFAEKECCRVDKILHKMDSCFEVLVPRIGNSYSRSFSKSFVKKCSSKDQSDDQDKEGAPKVMDEESSRDETDLIIVDEEENENDDIDWEDGDLNDCNESSSASIENNENKEDQDQDQAAFQENHTSAVEQTLAVMKQSGALQNGAISISFGRDESQEEEITRSLSETAEVHGGKEIEKEARELLEKCVKSLTKRYERLEKWVDALVSADNMTDSRRIKTKETGQQSSTTSSSGIVSSVIILPASIRKKKGPTLRALTESRNSAARALSAAAKIGIFDGRHVPKESPDTVNIRSQVKSGPDKSSHISQGASGALASVDSFAPHAWQNLLGFEKKTINTKDRLTSVLSKTRKKRSGKGRLQIKLRKS